METSTKKVRRVALQVEDFDDLTDVEHVLTAPAMYMASMSKEKREEWIFDFETKHMKFKQIEMPPAIERLFLEIISNAGDNIKRSKETGMTLEEIGPLEIMFNENTVSVKNGGNPIPVALHPKKGVYVPELIFGRLRSGSNFNKTVERTAIGVNGLGAKLTNIFSKKFTVYVGDKTRKSSYQQTWSDNMKNKTEPIVQPYEGPNFVQIVYELDFERFGYKGYSPEMFSVFARAALDTSYTSQTPLILQGHSFPLYSIVDYKKLFSPNVEEVDEEKFFVHKQVDEKSTIEVLVSDTPDNSQVISYVNGMITREGGVHVQAVYKVLAQALLTYMNSRATTNGGSPSKNTNTNAKNPKNATSKKKPVVVEKEKEKEKNPLNMGDVKPHLSVFMSCWLPSPEFNSQSKNCLTSPTPVVNIAMSNLEQMNDWNVIPRLDAALDAKQFRMLAKGDGKKLRRINIDKEDFFDANLAGSARSKECTLYVCEGSSASAYLVGLFDHMENGRDRSGIYPLRGKLLNVMNASMKRISDNHEIRDMKQVLGLREGMDYSSEAAFNTLRYGKIIIFTDSDVDGCHISGLMLNFFHCRFVSLLKRKFVFLGRTPILRAIKGKERLPFYTFAEYEKWKKSISEKKVSSYTIKYYKGLGTTEDADIEQDHKNAKNALFSYDDEAPESMRIAFHKHAADERKKWMTNSTNITDISDLKILPITSFINEEFSQFSLSNTRRTIPHFIDGMKESQRKIIFTVLEHWGWTKSKQSSIDEMKVAQLGSLAALKTQYHHGENNLTGAIENMVVRFMGTNNMPYLCNNGRFGTRHAGGKDKAQTRYTFTRPEFWIPYIFREEDKTLVPQIMDEGKYIEPPFLLPILPTVLFNGASCIGSGYSSFIPNYNPLDIIEWFKSKLTGKATNLLLPWYRNFTGIIRLKEKRIPVREKKEIEKKEEKKEEEETGKEEENGKEEEENGKEERVVDKFDHALEEDDDEEEGKKEKEGVKKEKEGGKKEREYVIKNSMISEGIFEWKNDGTVIIRELPIGMWTNYYNSKKLLPFVAKKKISDIRANHKSDTVHFELKGIQDTPTAKGLSLISSHGMSNMILLDENNLPKKFENVTEILETFYQFRFPYFEKRRLYMLDEKKKELKKKQEKVKFIHAIQKKEITPIDAEDEVVSKQMAEKGLSEEFLTHINIKNLMKTDTRRSEKEMFDIETEIAFLTKVTPQQIWLKDIEEFELAYRKFYKL